MDINMSERIIFSGLSILIWTDLLYYIGLIYKKNKKWSGVISYIVWLTFAWIVRISRLERAITIIRQDLGHQMMQPGQYLLFARMRQQKMNVNNRQTKPIIQLIVIKFVGTSQQKRFWNVKQAKQNEIDGTKHLGRQTI